jgi:tetratricopeptide (TPR) repeat protein
MDVKDTGIENINLEEILANLGSDEARRKAIRELNNKRVFKILPNICIPENQGITPIVKKRSEMVNIPNELIEEAIKYYKDNNLIEEAAYFAFIVGMKERAIKMYEDVGRFDDAEDIALGCSVKQEGTERYGKEKSWVYSATKIALKFGMKKMAIKMYEKAGLFNKAGEIAEGAEMYEKASEMYEKARLFFRAADVAEKAKMYEKSVDMYEKAGTFKWASAVASRSGMEEKANQLKTLVGLIISNKLNS